MTHLLLSLRLLQRNIISWRIWSRWAELVYTICTGKQFSVDSRLFFIWLIEQTSLQTSEYQSKKRECRRLRHKLFHIKRMVKDYDKNHWRVRSVPTLRSVGRTAKTTHPLLHRATLPNTSETAACWGQSYSTHTHTHTSRLTLHSVQSTESLPGKIMIKSCVYFHFLITNRHSSAYWSKMKAVLTVVASPDRTGEKAVVWNRFSVSWGNTKLWTQAEVELLTGIVWQQICSSVNLWCSLCCRRASLELFSHKCQYLQPP